MLLTAAVHQAWINYCAHRCKGADSIYVAVAEHLGVPLISWDGEHNSKATALITMYTPATAPSCLLWYFVV
jgi:predicted nucleic acid-binding protein